MCCRNVTQAAAGSCCFCRARLAATHVVAIPGVFRDSSCTISVGNSPPRPLQRNLTRRVRALARVAHSPERAVTHTEIDEDCAGAVPLRGTGIPAPDDREHAD